MAIKMIKNLLENHSCVTLMDQFDEKKPPQLYNMFELFEHVEQVCPKSRTCINCEIEFDDQEQFNLHLRYACEHVPIECNLCNEHIKRREFRFHKCFMQTTLGLIEDARKKELHELKEKINEKESKKEKL